MKENAPSNEGAWIISKGIADQKTPHDGLTISKPLGHSVVFMHPRSRVHVLSFVLPRVPVSLRSQGTLGYLQTHPSGVKGKLSIRIINSLSLMPNGLGRIKEKY